MINKLNRFYLTQNISIDNALSMNQILHQIINQMNEIVDHVNNLELDANQYTDRKILELKNQIEEQLSTLEQTLKTYTNNAIDNYNSDVITPQLNSILNNIHELDERLNNRISHEVEVLNHRINSVESSLIVLINDTKEYLEDLIKKGNSYVYSGVSGMLKPLQEVISETTNAFKQMLSYDWNTIKKLSEVNQVTLSLGDSDNLIIRGSGVTTKGIFIQDIVPQIDSDTDELEQYIYIQYNTTSIFDDIPVGSTSTYNYGIGYSNGDDVNGSSVEFKKINNRTIKFNIGTAIRRDFDISKYPFVFIHLTQYDSQQGQVVPIFSDFSKVNVIYNYNMNFKIDYVTLHNQMLNDEIPFKPNWNGLVYDGVNSWNRLASYNGLYNGNFINYLWGEYPYSNNVKRNENSLFYNQIVEGV